MNKTIIININGIIFHIEEDAYEVLQTYMTAVKKHFGYSTDSNEIVGDIENRIAEMFSERINTQKAVITMQDVNEVTAQMGNISDFDDFNENAEDPLYQDQLYTESRGLFRDPDDKVIGGVCSGLGYYFDLEAKWFRLILVIMALVGGSGFIVYLIFWILMPLARTRADKMSMRGEAPNLQNFAHFFHSLAEHVGVVEAFSGCQLFIAYVELLLDAADAGEIERSAAHRADFSAGDLAVVDRQKMVGRYLQLMIENAIGTFAVQVEKSVVGEVKDGFLIGMCAVAYFKFVFFGKLILNRDGDGTGKAAFTVGRNQTELSTLTIVHPSRPYLGMKAIFSSVERIFTVVRLNLISFSVDTETSVGQAVGKAAHRYAVKDFMGVHVFIDMIETQHHVGGLTTARGHNDADNPRAVVAQRYLHAALIIQNNQMRFGFFKLSLEVGF